MIQRLAAALCLGALIGGGATVFAQDATAQINEADVVLDHEMIVIDPTDGGCTLAAYGHAQFPSVNPARVVNTYPLGPVLCTALKAAGLRAVKFDMRRVGVPIGDGGVP